MRRLREGLVFKAHELCVSLNSRRASKKAEEDEESINTCAGMIAGDALGLADDLVGGHEVLLRRDEKLLAAASSHRMLTFG